MKLLATIATAVGILGLTSAAQAMPMAPTEAPSAVTTVAGGCGPGWHPNPWGACVRSYRRGPPPRFYRDGGWDRGRHEGWERGRHRGWDRGHHRGWRD
jgi:hypothetical protein